MSSDDNQGYQSPSSESIEDGSSDERDSPEIEVVDPAPVRKFVSKEKSSSATDFGLGKRVRTFDRRIPIVDAQPVVAVGRDAVGGPVGGGVVVRAERFVDAQEEDGQELSPAASDANTSDGSEGVLTEEVSATLNLLVDAVVEITGNRRAAEAYLEAFKREIRRMAMRDVVARAANYMDSKIDQLTEAGSVRFREMYRVLRNATLRDLNRCVMICFVATFGGFVEHRVMERFVFSELVDGN